MKHSIITVSAIALSASLAGGAMSQETDTQDTARTLNTVTVTARKKDESVQDVPISIYVTSGADIEESGVKGLEELSQTLPAVNISKGGASDQLYVRGIGSGFNGGFEQAVGTYVDGVYYGRSRNTRSIFMDVERLEVLKGPQTTFFGNSSIGGALSIVTRDPGSEYGGNASILYTPDFGETDLQAGVDVPLSDTFRVRLAGRKYDTDGFYTNTVPGAADVGTFDDWGFRATAVWDATSDLTIKLKYGTGASDTNGQFAADVYDCPVPAGQLGAPPPRPCPANLANFPVGDPSRFDDQIDFRSQSGGIEPTTSEFDTFSLAIDYAFETVDFTSITAFNQFEQREVQDLDQGPDRIFNANQFDGFESFSQEFRLASTNSSRFEWLIGAYYYEQDVDFDALLQPYFIPPVAGGFGVADNATTFLANFTDSNSSDESYSIFASGTYDLADTFRVNLGLRYTDLQKSWDNENYWVTFNDPRGVYTYDRPLTQVTIPFPGFATPSPRTVGTPLSFSKFLPSIGFEWDVGSDGLLYGDYRQGFKGGGFDLTTRSVIADGSNIDDFAFGEEEVDSYELGYKGLFLDGRLKTNANLFYSEYTGVQQSVLDAATFVFSVDNAAASSTQGLELELAYEPINGLLFSADATFMEAQFDEFIGACSEFQNQTLTCPNAGGVVGAQDLSGNETTFAPSYSGNIRAKYDTDIGDWGLTIDGRIFLSDSYHIQSDFDPRIEVDAFERVDLRVALAPPTFNGTDWEFAIVGKNLTDEKVSNFCNDLSASPGSYRCSLNPPASVALYAGVKW